MAEIPERWIRAETYPIEGFWSTQILDRRAEVVCIANGHTEKQSIERALRIVAAEARIKELEQERDHWMRRNKTQSFSIGSLQEDNIALQAQLAAAQQERDALLQQARRKPRTVERIELSPGGHEMHVTDEVECDE